jgi:para-nitrobenzyl esterase
MNAAGVAGVVVETAGGKVRGSTREGGTHIFKGSPYGAGTAGANRFKLARPSRWVGVRDATQFGPSAPQAPAGVSGAEHVRCVMDVGRHAEDCLVLNIFTANLESADPVPVMIYIHGGGFLYGSGAAAGTDGENLAERGVVLVSLNHRLGVFGHLYLGADGEYRDSGNIGLIDIVMALQWVRDNISRFGGDPDNVTIFGQSGGGSKVAALLAMPKAHGLFHKAIIQSASSMLRMATIDEAERNARFFLDTLGSAGPRLGSLQRMPPECLVSAMQRAVVAAGGIDNFRPVVDGVTLPCQPFDRAALRLSKDVPVMLGWCETEQRMAFSLQRSELDQTFAQARARVANYLGVPEDDAASLLDVYRSGRGSDTPGDIMALIYGDHRYRRAVTRAAEVRAQTGAASYLYLLRWRTPVLNGLLRSPHLLCLPFVFANVDRATELTGTGEDRYPLQEEMSGAWLQFAKTGSPNHPRIPRWEPYCLPERHTMTFDVETRSVKDPAADQRIAFEGLPAYLPAEAEGGRRR